MQQYLMQYIILMPLSIQLLGLLPVVKYDKYIRKDQQNLMALIIGAVTILMAQNVVENILGTSLPMPYLRTILSILGYILRPTIIVLFCKLVVPDKKHRIAWLLIIINACIYLTALFSPVIFYISEDNHYTRGSFLNYSVYVISAVLLVYLIYCTLSEHKYKSSTIWTISFNVLLIIIASVLDSTPFYIEYPVSYLTIAVVNCTMFYYIWLHIEFVRMHENSLKAEQRIQIMMSQIQPHFLYNTLSTIQALCLTAPEKAAEVTERFGTYLRKNLDYLEQTDLIPLKNELEHTKIYTEIENVRFPNLKVEYDIQEDDFLLPALTIQPLVENAIRHGVRSRQNGLIKVCTKKNDEFYIITISDNGIGFNPDEIDDTERKHIGIANVSERIETMCSGSLTIDSEINVGTTIIILIPRSKE